MFEHIKNLVSTKTSAIEQLATSANSASANAQATAADANSAVQVATSKANDAAEAAQRAQNTANSAVEVTNNNKNRISSIENNVNSLQSAIEQGKSGAWGGGRTKIHTLTVAASSFSDNKATIAIPDALAGAHIVRTVGLKPANEVESKAYSAAAPIFLDSDDDSSISVGHLRIVVKKPADLKFTILEQEVKQ